MSDWVEKCSIPNDAELLIQMDIEGAEYDFFLFEKPEFFREVQIHYC
jgi:hypothetical protein